MQCDLAEDPKCLHKDIICQSNDIFSLEIWIEMLCQLRKFKEWPLLLWKFEQKGGGGKGQTLILHIPFGNGSGGGWQGGPLPLPRHFAPKVTSFHERNSNIKSTCRYQRVAATLWITIKVTNFRFKSHRCCVSCAKKDRFQIKIQWEFVFSNFQNWICKAALTILRFFFFDVEIKVNFVISISFFKSALCALIKPNWRMLKSLKKQSRSQIQSEKFKVLH